MTETGIGGSRTLNSDTDAEEFAMRRFLRRGAAIALALACAAAIGAREVPPETVPAGAPPDRFTLPVTLHPQETVWWCWAATGQMTMEFFGKPVSQAEQANRIFGRSDCGQQPCPNACVRGSSINLIPFGFTCDMSSNPLSQDELVRQFYTLRKPVPFAWQFPGGGGHASLAVGYVKMPDGTFLVECLDPWPPPGRDKRSWTGGQRVFMPYARWAHDYDHVFGGAMYNVVRKP
jgi:hypothetical protein